MVDALQQLVLDGEGQCLIETVALGRVRPLPPSGWVREQRMGPKDAPAFRQHVAWAHRLDAGAAVEVFVQVEARRGPEEPPWPSMKPEEPSRSGG